MRTLKKVATRALIGPKDRLLRAATRLFYSQGYASTGVQAISDLANAQKRSLYLHFESKEELGLAYLRKQGEFFRRLLKSLARRHKRFEDYVNAWVRYMRTEHYNGCPIAAFGLQTLSMGKSVRPEIASILDDWREEFLAYIARCEFEEGAEPNRRNLAEFAEEFLTIYEGSSLLYTITGDERYLDRMGRELKALPARFASNN